MSNRADFRLVTEVKFQNVNSEFRNYGVMFNPSSSKSRLGIVDSGKRYEIRLTKDGNAEYFENGEWKTIVPLEDNILHHARFLSFNKRRKGEEQFDVKFDMIAVGRGRVVAKRKDTDQIYHLVMDELFRTYEQKIISLSNDEEPGEDPAVPGAYFKLDPEFFKITEHSPTIPETLKRNYHQHPASLRFKVFEELLKTKKLDATIITQKPREWHLIDARSPLAITAPEDLKISEKDFIDVFDEDRLNKIIYTAYLQNKEEATLSIYKTVYDALRRSVNDFWDITGVSGLSSRIRRFLRDLIGRQALDALDEIVNVPRRIARFVGGWIKDHIIVPLIDFVGDRIFKEISKSLARETARQIRAEGFGALILPANFFTLFLLDKLRGNPGNRPIDTRNGFISVHPRKVMAVLDSLIKSNADLDKGIEILMRRARKRYFETTFGISDDITLSTLISSPNRPAPTLPVYLHTKFEERNGDAEKRRYAVAFTKILDLGVGYSHWSEHWQLHFGGEMHSLLATRPIAQQEQYNLIQYRFLNGPVKDGDAFNDGTCNFYMLVKLKESDQEADVPFIARKKPHLQKQKYAILWIDEQTYFTQRWRLAHPTQDILGDLFSVGRAIKDNPEYFQFDQQKFWQPFTDDLINDDSRMVVKRQIILLTGRNKAVHEIYSICFNYGVCDHSWRWRHYPKNTFAKVLDEPHLIANSHGLPMPDNEILSDINYDGQVFVNAIELRDDTTIVLKGFKFFDNNGNRSCEPGRWYQKYLPADFRHVPNKMNLISGRKPDRGFDFEWQFVSEKAYQLMDQFYGFGIYEEETSSRCQYYEVDILEPDKGREQPAQQQIEDTTWCNDSSKGTTHLFFNTINFNWNIEKDDDGYIPLRNLIKDKRFDKTLSMYESTTRFKILERKPFGYIAIFYDKRDDELQPASHLPQAVTLYRETKEYKKPLRKKGFDQDSSEKEDTTRKELHLKVLFKSNIRSNFPPIITKAVIKKEITSNGPFLKVSFWTPQTEEQVNQNIWQITLGALDTSGLPDVLFKVERFGNFTRTSIPSKPLPFEYEGDLGDDYRYDYFCPLPANSVLEQKVNLYCTEKGSIDFGTSLWFEDVIGHKACSQKLVFE